MNAYCKLTLMGLRAFLRDRSALFFSLFFPLFFMIIFGVIFGGADNSEKGIQWSVGLVVQDSSPMVAWVPQVFQKIPVFEMHTGTLASETDALRAGKRRAVIVFPADFSTQMQSGQTTNVAVYFDPAQQQTAQMVTGVIRQVIAGMDQRMSGRPTLLQAKEEPVAPRTAAEKKLRSVDFLIPGIIAMTIMQLGLFTAIPIVLMREKGILKRLRATPLPRPTLVASQITMRLLISVGQTLLLLAVGTALFQFHVIGSWPVLIGMVVFGTLTFICLGALLSGLARTQEGVVPMVQMVNMPMMFLSGLFFPLEFIPAFLRPVTNMLPATHLADVLRHAMLASPTAYSMPNNLAVMGAWMLGCLLVTARTFRWE